MENIFFNLTNEKGETKEYEAISLIELDNKKYIWYREKGLVDDKADSFISKYEIIGDDLKIIPITDEKEWENIEKSFKAMPEEMK